MAATHVMDHILLLLQNNNTVKQYSIREGFEGPISETDVERGLVEVTFDPADVTHDDDYQGLGCVRVVNNFLFRITRRHTNINPARRLVLDMADDVKSALSTSDEALGAEGVRIQTPAFGPLTIETVSDNEIEAELNVVQATFQLSVLEYQTPGSR